jgi:hypothetical protein
MKAEQSGKTRKKKAAAAAYHREKAAWRALPLNKASLTKQEGRKKGRKVGEKAPYRSSLYSSPLPLSFPSVVRPA